ncbi:MAG: hypothetical protein O8C66_05240 [Candidatus Methanoperedens sp.]|nr:hypothetical protein [Candidatus Methanoperedens sp.]MCZ7369895.1 hypothetical protein [Candidatus Methanoperedens sp.]
MGDHVCDLGGDGRGLACACEDELGGLGVLYGFELAGLRGGGSLMLWTLPFYA